MGRETRRVHKNLKEPMGETFWGYLLDSIPCQSCNGTGKFGAGEKDYCAVCEGEGTVSPEVKLPAYAVGELPSWFSVEVLSKDFGWQMWATTSEGSPMSPVLDTPEELAHWLADSKASAFGGMTATYDEWLRMITGSGSAPSAVLTVSETGKGTLQSGVAAS